MDMKVISKRGYARSISTNEVIGVLKDIGFNVVRQGIASITVDVRIALGIFKVDPITGLQESTLGIRDTNEVFQFDVELFDDAAGDSHDVIHTVKRCYITNHTLTCPDKEGKWVLQDICCDGREIVNQ